MRWILFSSCAIKKHSLSLMRFIKTRGFTLTEFAIVLGVGGIIVGGIWAIASNVQESVRQQRFKEDLSIIVKNIRSFAASQNGVTGKLVPLTATLTSITPPPIPGDMLVPSGTGGCTATGACVFHQWEKFAASVTSGNVLFCAWDPSASNCTAGTSQFLRINVQGLSVQTCIRAAVLNSGADAPPGLYDVIIQGNSMLALGHGFPVVASDAQSACAGGGATIDFIYRIVTPQY